MDMVETINFIHSITETEKAYVSLFARNEVERAGITDQLFRLALEGYSKTPQGRIDDRTTTMKRLTQIMDFRLVPARDFVEIPFVDDGTYQIRVIDLDSGLVMVPDARVEDDDTSIYYPNIIKAYPDGSVTVEYVDVEHLINNPGSLALRGVLEIDGSFKPTLLNH